MKVLFISSEVTPFAKTGGLADVAGALPVALRHLGHDVRVAMPCYSQVKYMDAPALVLPWLDVALGAEHHSAAISEARLPGSDVPIYFVSNSHFFDRPGLYHEGGHDYGDNAQRFAFFCKAVLWMVKGLGWIPDVIHCNDWQTGLLPALLHTDPVMSADPELRNIRTVYTIHNMAYQGYFPADSARALGLNMDEFHPRGMEFYGQLNLMKCGLIYGDHLTTVSPTYAREIQTPEYGCALDGVLRDRSDHLTGILNGIDYDQWNPATDKNLPEHYSADAVQGKTSCKAALQGELGLQENPQTPLVVMISRLDPQKGFDIVLPAIHQMMLRNLQVAILGTGLPEYHFALEQAAETYSGRLAVRLKFDEGLAHRMEAGADIFLMPSRYEPCGLNQMYSLRYGTVPIVRHTGGLADSVEQAWQDGSRGTGFIFGDYRSEALLVALDSALRVHLHRPAWAQIQRRGMLTDHSWAASAEKYVQVYESAISR